jgi:hypothetical protein
VNAPNPIIGFIPILVILFVAVPLVIAWIKIFSRVGWASWLGVLMFIPLVNIVLMLVLGFKEWPIEKRLKALAETRPASSTNI